MRRASECDIIVPMLFERELLEELCKRGFAATIVFLRPKEVREAVFREGGEFSAAAKLSLPALQIQFMQPFISFSNFCSSFKSRKPARDSTRSFSLANSLGGRRLFVQQTSTLRDIGKGVGKGAKMIYALNEKNLFESSEFGGLTFCGIYNIGCQPAWDWIT